jgi:hypothetical protein
MTTDQLVGEQGTEVIHYYRDGGPKACLALSGSMAAGGSCLPLVLIARGTTELCHQQFEDHLFMLDSWEELFDSVILASWDLDETPADLESDDSSNDEEFDLAVNSDSDVGYADWPDEEEACPESVHSASTRHRKGSSSGPF